MPQGGTTVVYEVTTSGPKVEAQVDVLETVVVGGAESPDLLERALVDQEAGGGQCRPLDDGDGGSGTWVFASAQDAGRGHRLAPIERHPPMLEGQVRKSRSCPRSTPM